MMEYDGEVFDRVNRKAIVKAMRGLQQPDGSFSPVPGGSENDMRFVYCAAVISAMLDDFDGLDIDKAVEYILNSQVRDDYRVLHLLTETPCSPTILP